MKKEFQNIFIIDSKILFESNSISFDVENDLILTYDFALKKYISDLGGNAEYLDHVVDVDTMQENNYLIYKFFKNWHYDKDGNDIFTFKDISFGFSFRMDFWNDLVFFTRLYISLKYISKITYNNLYLKSNDESIIKILKELKVKFQYLPNNDCKVKKQGYYFPISKWMDSKTRPSGLRWFLYKIRERVTYYFAVITPYVDRLCNKKSKYTIFIQDYHPTKKLIHELRNDKNFTILLENFSRFSNKLKNLKERLLPISGNIEDYIEDENRLLRKFNNEKYHSLILSDGSDISIVIYEIILQRITGFIVHKLRTLDSCIKYINKNKVDLVILIANIGHTATLFDAVCKHKKIPSFLIINGILAKNYQDESKYATYINAYSKSIKENYFKGMQNIVTLGDSRMDIYHQIQVNTINRTIPTITIGTSGFNSTDLNSYVAVEFDFMYDILKAFSILKEKGEIFNIIIKVRPNGYLEQYQEFTKEYFKSLQIEFLSTTPMTEVLKKTDFYISIYSQTLFEASCLGIPVVYYKKDTEITNTPFDNNSELVTVDSVDDMIKAFSDFKEYHFRYNDFLDKGIMEKYIGYLDGDNFERNKNFILKLLEGIND
ncbi:hypothetical protein [Aliarcobacter butzleri]|uniref:hypothetical protein n=1 Tax=Aliarcobacter butzleri TaxID=28197 RepID=UPI003AF470BB